MTEHCDLNHAPIGVFDSGVGGLTVAREIMRQIPDERIVYFGDTARVPYGSKSPNTIIRYSRQIIRFLRTKNVKAIVVACNTASAFALETIKPELAIPIIGVVKPGAKVAAQTTQNGKIGVIGTEGTIRSEIYTKTIHRENKDAQVMGRACPLLVPLVQEGWIKDPVPVAVAESYHQQLKESVVELRRLLSEQGIANDGKTKDGEEKYQFYVSDAAEKFMQFANSILPYDIEQTQLIPIEEY